MSSSQPLTTPVKLILVHSPSSLRGHSPAGTACPVVMPALGLSLYSVACVPRCDACPRVALVLGYLCGHLSKYTILCSVSFSYAGSVHKGEHWKHRGSDGNEVPQRDCGLRWCQTQLRGKDHISFLFRNEQTTTAS